MADDEFAAPSSETVAEIVRKALDDGIIREEIARRLAVAGFPPERINYAIEVIGLGSAFGYLEAINGTEISPSYGEHDKDPLFRAAIEQPKAEHRRRRGTAW